jgi:hypothetical protein
MAAVPKVPPHKLKNKLYTVMYMMMMMIMYYTEEVSVKVMLLTYIQKMLESNPDQNTAYPDRSSSWLSSVNTGK